jgi:hypothetical protein
LPLSASRFGVVAPLRVSDGVARVPASGVAVRPGRVVAEWGLEK